MPKFPLDGLDVREELSIDVGTKITIPAEDKRGGSRGGNGHTAYIRYKMEIGASTYPRRGEVDITASLNDCDSPTMAAEMLIETLEHALNTIRVQLSEKGVL